MNRVNSSTTISLEISEQMLFALQLFKAGLMDIEDRQQPLSIDTLWLFLRHKICELEGFRHIAAGPYENSSPPSLSRYARLLVKEIGQDMSDPLKVKDVLDGYQKRDHLFDQQPHVLNIISEVRAYAVAHLGPLLSEVLPACVFHLHQSKRATCEGCLFHGASPKARDGWNIEASPSSSAVEKANSQLYALIQAT